MERKIFRAVSIDFKFVNPGARIVRVARVADAGGALLEEDAGELDLAGDVGLGLAELDARHLEDAAVALVLEVLLVGDEVGEVLGIAENDVERRRELVLLRRDLLDRRLPQDEVVALAAIHPVVAEVIRE